MSPQPGDSRAARATLTYLAEPADPLLGTLLRETDPCEIVAAIRSGAVPDSHVPAAEPGSAGRSPTKSGEVADEAGCHPGWDWARLP